jgi:hypothetical protein
VETIAGIILAVELDVEAEVVSPRPRIESHIDVAIVRSSNRRPETTIVIFVETTTVIV